jgi:hypothetical protein
MPTVEQTSLIALPSAIILRATSSFESVTTDGLPGMEPCSLM